MIVTVSKKGFAEMVAKSFKTKIRGKIFKGFVVLKEGKYYAYQNLCQHLPITLDLNDGEFFTHNREFLQCHMHGAIYQVDTGLCIAGPCIGANLIKLDVEEEATQVLVKIP